MRIRSCKIGGELQQGFSLIEVGVVLVIVGLLMAAILQGQELIRSAQVYQLAQSINGYRAAIVGFKARYRMMPGDSSRASIRLGPTAVNCTLCCDNGLLDCWANTSLVNNHLSVTGFYDGPSSTIEYDQPFSYAGLPSRYLLNPNGSAIYARFTGDYFGENGSVWANTPKHQVISGDSTAKMLAALDRKLDDGVAKTGSIRAGGWNNGACSDLATGAWGINRRPQ